MACNIIFDSVAVPKYTFRKQVVLRIVTILGNLQALLTYLSKQLSHCKVVVTILHQAVHPIPKLPDLYIIC